MVRVFVTDGDALCYHLQVPKVFLWSHATGFEPDLHEKGSPIHAEGKWWSAQQDVRALGPTDGARAEQRDNQTSRARQRDGIPWAKVQQDPRLASEETDPC